MMSADTTRDADEALRDLKRPETTMVSLRMPIPLYDEVCRVAIARDVTSTTVITAAVHFFLSKLEPGSSL